MPGEVWRRAMLSLMARYWSLPVELGALRDQPHDPEQAHQLAIRAEWLTGVINSLLWLMSGLQPDGGLYTQPLCDTRDAQRLAQQAARNPSLAPDTQLFATMTSLQMAASCLERGFELMSRFPHASGRDAARFAAAGSYLVVPTSVVIGTLEILRETLAAGGPPAVPGAWRGTAHLAELLARCSLHLLCVGAVGRPASTGLPSPLLRPPGYKQGTWPGFDRWLQEWSGRFPEER